MKITTGTSAATAIRHVDITDGPVVPLGWSADSKEILVDHIQVTYTWRDGRWAASNSTFDVNISGHALKKDGTPSKNRLSRRQPSIRQGDEPWPWLDRIIDLLRPEGELTMDSYREHETEG